MRTVLKRTTLHAAAILIGGGFAGASASPLTGMLYVNGNVTVTATSIVFNPMGMINLDADVLNNTGGFAGLNTGNVSMPDTGAITSLTGGPITGPVNVNNFITFNTGGLDFAMNLTYIAPSNFMDTGAGCTANPANAAAGNTCALQFNTGMGSAPTPFNLADQNTGTVQNPVISAVISFGVAGNVVNLAGGGTDPFTGSFSETVNGTSYEQILAAIQGTPGFFTTNFTANFTASAAPEPGTMGMLFIGLGMVAIAGLGGWRSRNDASL